MCWWRYGGSPGGLLAEIQQWRANGARPLDVSSYDPFSRRLETVRACTANSNPANPIYRPWDIDVGVDRQTAITLANNNRMAIVSVAPIVVAGNVRFVTLREQLPQGVRWTWVPGSTPQQIQQWLGANPARSPIAVDSFTSNGTTDFSAQALLPNNNNRLGLVVSSPWMITIE